MSLRQILGSRFGHFASTAPAALTAASEPGPEDEEAKRAAAKKAEDEEEEMRRAERKKAEEDEEMRRSRRARRARKGRKAKDGDDEDDAGEDDEDEEDEDEMKRAAAAGHDLALEAAFRAGARAQRRRCAAIFDAKAAALNPGMAAHLAFETPLTASAAVALLEKAPAPRSALAERMMGSGAGNLRVGPSGAEAPKGEAALAASWDVALKPFAASARHQKGI